MTGDIRALLSRHLPGYRVHSVTRLGHGLDNMVYEVNDELLVRLRQAADPLSHRQEVGRLRGESARGRPADPDAGPGGMLRALGV